MTRTEVENEIVRLKAVYDAIKSTSFDENCERKVEFCLEDIRRREQQYVLLLKQKI